MYVPPTYREGSVVLHRRGGLSKLTSQELITAETEWVGTNQMKPTFLVQFICTIDEDITK